MNTALLPPIARSGRPTIPLVEHLLISPVPGAEPPLAAEGLSWLAAHPAPAEAERTAPAPPHPALAPAAALLDQGQVEAAQVLLRAVPQQGTRRSEAVSLTYLAASQDSGFQDFIARADAARDRQQWADAEYLYWRALALYPLHGGYMVQYGHTLKEQGKLPDAEITYRSALALGEASADLPEHIAHVAGLLGHADETAVLRRDATRVPRLPLDEAPSRDDIELAFALLLHRPPRLVDEILPLMRTARTRRAVFLRLLAGHEVVVANRDLMLLLAQTP